MKHLKILSALLLVLASACVSIPVQSKTLIDNDSPQTLSNKTLDTTNTINATGAALVTPTLTSPTVSSGVLTLIPGQLAFPATQNPSANVNTLDDYQEAPWTPSVGGTATYTTQDGASVKIGQLMFVRARLAINAIGSGSTTTVSGLPCIATESTPGTVGFFSGIATPAVFLSGYVSGTTFIMSGLEEAATSMTQPFTTFNSGTQVHFTVTYLCL